jgi:hypothetical protein
MIALISEIGDESRWLLVIEESEGERLRREEIEVRMLEKERDWKRAVRILAVVRVLR